jgi:hypothetical protein
MVYAFAMAHATRLTHALVLLLAVPACNRKPPEDAAKAEPVVAKQAKPEPKRVEPSAKCAELAQAFCERAPVPCDAAAALFTRARLDDAACSHGKQQLIATDEMPLEVRTTAHVAVLEQIIRSSKIMKKEQLAATIAQARAMALGGVKPDATPQPGDITCPGVATRKGTAGDELWCEKADGKRHGEASKWNAKHELVRTIEYRDGNVVSVAFHYPASSELPAELFVCPEGEQAVETTKRGVVLRSCEKDGTRTIAVSWTDGKVSEIANAGAADTENRIAG